jgi:hypothetical protein
MLKLGKKSVVLVPPFCSQEIYRLIVRKTAALFAETLCVMHGGGKMVIRNVFGIKMVSITEVVLCWCTSPAA